MNISLEELNEFKKKSKLLEPLMRGEFLNEIKLILNFVKKLKEENSKAMSDFVALVKKTERKLSNDSSNNLAKIKADFKKEANALRSRYNDLMANAELKIAELRDGRDGRDADDEMILERLKSEVPTVEDFGKQLPQMATGIRDALELLTGKERLNVSAIDGLSDMLNEFKKKYAERPLGSGGGGFSKIAMEGKFVDDETPSGLVNGTNKVFTIAKAPNPTGSLKVYKDGQRMIVTEDYTLSGNTITFTTAPLANTIITVDYRK